MDQFEITKILALTTLSFLLAVAWTPLLTHFLFKYKCWKKKVRTTAPDGSATPIFAKLHGKNEISTPRMGGLLVWVTTVGIALIIAFIAWITKNDFWNHLNFLSRKQTWIPLFTLAAASILGLIDDIMVVKGIGPIDKGAGLSFRFRASIVLLIALVGAYWFNIKLEWSSIHIPFIGDFTLGWLYIPLFVFVMLVVFSGSVIDGVDGLAGGVFATIFSTYAAIAFMRGQYDLATLCAVIVGALLAFLWFNIPPARFYLSETGTLGLTTTLSVIAFLTDSVPLLFIIGILIFIEVASVVIQLTSKKIFKRKVFLSAPIHHHFEALGWPKYKVTMRFWVVSLVAAVVGFIIFLIDRSL